MCAGTGEGYIDIFEIVLKRAKIELLYLTGEGYMEIVGILLKHVKIELDLIVILLGYYLSITTLEIIPSDYMQSTS